MNERMKLLRECEASAYVLAADLRDADSIHAAQATSLGGAIYEEITREEQDAGLEGN